METKEAQDLYGRIADFVQQVAMTDGRPESDLLAEVEAEIEARKPVTVRLRVSSEERIADPVAGDRTAGMRESAQFIERRAFSSQEKLEILVESLALAAAGPALMAQEITTILFDDVVENEHEKGFRGEIFLARDENLEPERIIQPDLLPEQAAAARSLLRLLDEVRTALRPSAPPEKNETD